jgi:hypothetical protein
MIEFKDNLDHMDSLIDAFRLEFEKKYTKGVRSHGGGLWKKPHLIQEAKGEILDLWAYMLSLNDQIANCLEVLQEEVLPYTTGSTKEAVKKAIQQFGSDD